MHHGEYFIKRDFELYDYGVVGALNPVMLNLYELLRRFIWRSREHGGKHSRQALKKGLLAARLNRGKLAMYLNVSERTISRQMSELRSLGWVDVYEPELGGEFVYVLGQLTEDSKGRRHEAFYADAWLRELRVFMEKKARQAYQFAENEAFSIHVLDITDRVELVKQFSEDGSGADPRTPVSRPPGHQCLDPQDTSVSPLKEEKNKEREDQSLAASGSDPRGASRGAGSDPAPPPSSEEVPPASYSSAHPPTSPLTTKKTLEEVVAAAKERTGRQVAANVEKSLAKDARRENLNGKSVKPSMQKQLKACEAIWLSDMRDRFPAIKIPAWGPKERAQCKQLIEKYDGAIIEQALHYLISRWDVLRERIFKTTGTVPSVGLLLKMHDVLVLESQGWAAVEKVEREYRQWFADHPHDVIAPPELEARWQKVQKDAEAFGGGK